MTLIEKRYIATRGGSTDTYQSCKITVEMSNCRQYIIIEPDYLNRWRSKEELADYLRWMASEVEKIPTEEK